SPLAFGASCDVVNQNCETGLSCIGPSGQSTGRCQRPCRTGQDVDCGGFGAGNMTCAPVNLGGGYGLCESPPQACVLYDDRCPQGQHCTLLGSEEAMCVDLVENPVPLGGACSAGT